MKFNLSNLEFKKSTWYLISGMFIWAIYWGYTTYTFVLPIRTKSVEWFNKDCKETIERCAEINAADLSRTMSYEIQVIFGQIAFSLIVFWCFFVTFKYLYKFIKDGFLNEFKWAGVSLLRKASIVLLGLFNAIVIVILYFTIDEYQKTSYVAVIPNTNVFVSKYPNKDPEYITATGSWKNVDEYYDSYGYSKIQGSRIRCEKSKNTCYEATSSADGKYMHVDLIDYPIINWNDDSVTYGGDGSCRRDLMTINVSTKSVSRSIEYLHNAGCDTSLKNEYSQMVDGFDIYWKERQKLDSLIAKFIKFVLNIRDEDN
jgi:hypothetical protein